MGLTATEHITKFVLPVFAAVGLTWLTLGTIAPLILLDLKYSWDSPLTVLRRIAEGTSSELQIRRVGSTGYVIDLVLSIGASAATADVRSEKNLEGLRVDKSGTEQANRVYPKGASQDSEFGTMARAAWNATANVGNVVTIADPAGGDDPILFDGQLVGNYLRTATGALTAVTASSAASQTVTVASAAGVTVGDLVQFRADSAGADLTYLDSPPDIAAAGGAIKAGTIELGDIPAANNLIKNPGTRSWPGSSSAPPANWGVIGSPVIAKQTTGAFVKTGGNSIKVNTTASGDGVITASVPVFPTTENPYGSGYASVWVVTGQVRVELRITTATGTLTHPVPPAVANNSVSGQFVELGISGEDLKKLGATAVAILVLQNGATAAQFYVDSAQFTQTASQEPFVEGSGGTKLWQAANERLRTSGGVLVSYDASILDLARLDPATWGDDAKLVLGGDVRIREPRLSVAVRTRITEIERDYLTVGQTRAVLSNKPDDLSGTLSRPKRIRRVPTSLDDASLSAEKNPTAFDLIGFNVISESDTRIEYGWTRGSLVDSVWVGQLDFDLPKPADPWDAVKASVEILPDTQNSIVVNKPAAKTVKLLQVEPRDSNLMPGKPWQVEIQAPAPQTPEFESDEAENDTTGTRFVRPQTRGEEVDFLQFQVQTGKQDASAWMEPTRIVGAFSYVKQRTLVAQEVEFDVLLDDTRTTRATPRAILRSGEIVTLPPSYFDRNTLPNIELAWAEGSIATVLADSDTKSVRIQHVDSSYPSVPLGWEYWQDGSAIRVDVQRATGNGLSGSQTPMPGTATWPLLGTAYSKPRADSNVLTSPLDTVKITVAGSTAAPNPLWEYVNVAAPSVGSVVVPIVLDADTSTGLTARVRARHKIAGSWVDDFTITAALSPVPTTPPLAATTYTWSGLSTDFVRTENENGAVPIELEITAEILNGSGLVVATATRSALWYYGAQSSPPSGGGGGGGSTGQPPTAGPTPDPVIPFTPPAGWYSMSLTGPASNGLKNVGIDLYADSADGVVELLMRYDDGYGWNYRDITSAVTPVLSSPPTSLTSYNWNGLSVLYAKQSTGTSPITVEITANIRKSGVVTSTLTQSVSWYYTDTRV